MTNVRAVLSTLLAFFDAYKAAKASKEKLSFRDIFRLGPALYQLPAAVNALSGALSEWENADDDERKSLIADFNKMFSYDDQTVVAKVDAIVAIAIKIGAIGPDVRRLFKKVEAAAVAVAEAANAEKPLLS